MFPEVVLFAEADDMILSYADFVAPDRICFVILLVNGRPEPVLRNFENLRQIFPSPGQSLLLEIIAKGEVSEHFEECAVTGCVSDVFYIVCADTFLARCHASAGRGELPREIFFQRRHSGDYQKKRFVVFGNEGVTAAAEVSLRLKKREE